jgi:hypothetical protein
MWLEITNHVHELDDGEAEINSAKQNQRILNRNCFKRKTTHGEKTIVSPLKVVKNCWDNQNLHDETRRIS